MTDPHMQDLMLSRDRIHERSRNVIWYPLQYDLKPILTIGDQQAAMALHSYQEYSKRINRRTFPLLGWMKKIREQLTQY